MSAIGDVLHGVPVLCALREALPEAYIAWVVEGRNGELLRGHPALDELVVVPRHWLESPAKAWQVRKQLRALRCNIAIDLQGLTKSAVASWLSGARRRIGFDGPDGRELSRWLNNERVLPHKTHVIDRNLELLQALDIASPRVRFDLPEVPAAAATAAAMIQQLGLGQGFAIINPGAGWPSKIWPRERFAAVAQHLGRTRRLPSLVVWAGDAERQMAEYITAHAGSSALLAPPTSLQELAAIVRRANLFISADTGPLHLAVAVGTCSVGLFGPVPAQRNGPYGSQHIALQQMQLTGTNRERRTASSAAMEEIRVEHVCDACDQVLDRQSQRLAS